MSLPCLLNVLTTLLIIAVEMADAIIEAMNPMRHSKVLAKATSFAPVRKPAMAPRKATPAVAAAMQYRTNMTLLATSIACIPSSIADGHLRLVKLTPGFSSDWMTAAGSKWNILVWLEHLVMFCDG